MREPAIWVTEQVSRVRMDRLQGLQSGLAMPVENRLQRIRSESAQDARAGLVGNGSGFIQLAETDYRGYGARAVQLVRTGHMGVLRRQSCW